MDGLEDNRVVGLTQPPPTTPAAQSRSAPPGRLTFELTSRRLVIGPLLTARRSHIDSLNDPEHMRYSEQRRRRHNLGTQLTYLDNADADFWPLDVCDTAGSSVGTMSCHLDHANRVVNLGIMIIPQRIRQGYGREAWTTVVQYWLTHGYKVECGCHEDNEAMLALTLYADMLYEGRRERHFRNDDGSYSALKLYGKVS